MGSAIQRLVAFTKRCGKVLTWKMTKRLSFEHAKNVLIALKGRLDAQGQQVFLDNCCSLCSKMRGIFGLQLKIFFMWCKVSRKMPKRHPFYSECFRELQMVFHDPTDWGQVRTMAMPGPDIMSQQLMCFADKWKTMKYNDRHILPPAAVTNVNTLLTHIRRECLSGIQPGRGTNRNERLHRDVNNHMRQSRYGVELAYALLTKFFYIHNGKIDAHIQQRTVRPITAYSRDRNTDEKFRLAMHQNITNASLHLGVSVEKLDITRNTMQEVLQHIQTLPTNDVEEGLFNGPSRRLCLYWVRPWLHCTLLRQREK